MSLLLSQSLFPWQRRHMPVCSRPYFFHNQILSSCCHRDEFPSRLPSASTLQRGHLAAHIRRGREGQGRLHGGLRCGGDTAGEDNTLVHSTVASNCATSEPPEWRVTSHSGSTRGFVSRLGFNFSFLEAFYGDITRFSTHLPALAGKKVPSLKRTRYS